MIQINCIKQSTWKKLSVTWKAISIVLHVALAGWNFTKEKCSIQFQGYKGLYFAKFVLTTEQILQIEFYNVEAV